VRVLLQPSNLVSINHEIYLPQTALWSPSNWITLRAQLDHLGVFNEYLPPNLD
jgi:hypothetical protein